jgi:hypothetical protein
MFAMLCRVPAQPERNDFSTLADGCLTDKLNQPLLRRCGIAVTRSLFLIRLEIGKDEDFIHVVRQNGTS